MALVITVLDLEREPLEFHETIPAGAIDYGSGIQQIGGMPVSGRADLITENRGSHEFVQDIRLRAQYQGNFEMPCARCLDPVAQTLEERFDLLFRPTGADTGASERAISTSDTEIGYYEQGRLAVEDVLREQVLLSLPARALCQQECKGICPHCGRNRNHEACACDTGRVDARWAALAELRSRIKTEG
ncbi:MAG TPA: DUF177 domain-containing protein [Acidobacteriaceae bacterium]|nr:DUF177 domain-containing protein [Acidobacteriaceae bacterium]